MFKKSLKLSLITIVAVCNLNSKLMALDSGLNNKTTYESLIIFGDSLSDNGNTYRISGRIYPGQAYSLGRFSNGPTWSEYLASMLNINPMDDKFFTNYAYGQAQIQGPYPVELSAPYKSFIVPDLEQQIDEHIKYLSDISDKNLSKLSYDNSLVMLFIGTNDFFNIDWQADNQQNKRKINELVAHLYKQITRLKEIGYEDIVVFSIRDIKLSPLAHQIAAKLDSDDYLKNLDDLALYFNKQLEKQKNETNDFFIYDTYEFDKSISIAIEENNGYDYSFYRENLVLADISSEYYINKGNYIDALDIPSESADSYFFYDRIHPTTQSHYIMAKNVYKWLPLRNN